MPRLLCLALCLVACSGAAQGLRHVTYPPQFSYLERREIKSVMWTLAADAAELNRMLRNGKLSDIDHGRVVDVLDHMREAAQELEAPGQRTNHPLIDANIDSFRRDLGIARDAAKAEPPNYFFAGAVAGACLYCHQSGG